ncbi:hypothetical protein TREMEDRAFT_14959, partial [Tremella mesenterica DSM 1558]|uniref:uncharacterized protein n=1 Tax=Tremella mesenterica (strain ATCC 24925 / CBS 8224 / DSM 1558 / NBRC 9311 / NRRL Y-6157 / RJB 2259-6 / UBC 559-6) TaxID=578456 RepID=UPI0003F498B5
VKHLVLDAGPFLSFTPLRHLAQRLYTTPQVVAELRDPRSREHFQNLGLQGVDVKVESPRSDALARVIEFSKKTGDYAVLSQTDLGVVALTLQYELMENGEANVRTELEGSEESSDDGEEPGKEGKRIESGGETEEIKRVDVEELSSPLSEVDAEHQVSEASITLQRISLKPEVTDLSSGDAGQIDTLASSQVVEDDEESGGEWITPSTLNKHRSHDLGLTTGGDDSDRPLAAACMTGDYAVQNVLLGMGLGLVGDEGKRISKVRSWVLRCHACFKICRDPSKRFCPSCGNATLLRTTITTSASGKQRIHLKRNFQYHLRGTKYSIPDSKPGRAKGQQKGGSGLILREDQGEWLDALKTQQWQKAKEEKKIAKGVLEGWNDPDWLPDILTVGNSGKGRNGPGGMPTIGHGRKNPNQARRKR